MVWGRARPRGDTDRLNGPVDWAVECFNFVEQKWPKGKKKKKANKTKGEEIKIKSGLFGVLNPT